MADYEFAKATTWDDVYWVHRQWTLDYNAEDHWAHRTRTDGRHSPEVVLGKLHLDPYPPDVLHRIFHTTRFRRHLDTLGYLRFRHWRIYAEYGLAGQTAVLWLYGDTLTIVFDDTALAQAPRELPTQCQAPAHRHGATALRHDLPICATVLVELCGG